MKDEQESRWESLRLSRREALRLCGGAVVGALWGCSSSGAGVAPGADAGVDGAAPLDGPPAPDAPTQDGAPASDGGADAAPPDAAADGGPAGPPPPELFLHLSDIHVGGGSFALPALQYTLATVLPAAAGYAVAATGDLVETGINLEAWGQYRDAIDAAGLTPARLFEVPGNHDSFLDGGLTQYAAHTVAGRNGRGTHYVTHVGPPGQRVRLVGINTAGAGDPVRDGAGYLQGSEVDELLALIAAEVEVPRATVVLGHHPPAATGLGLLGTAQHLDRLIAATGAVAYLFGHLHIYLPTWANRTLMAQAGTHGMDNPSFSLFAIDDGPVVKNVPLRGAAASVHVDFPVVMITRPADRALAVGLLPGDRNPWSLPRARGTAGHVLRAAVLAPGGATAVEFRIDGGALQPMTLKGTYYEALFDTPNAASCTIEVWAAAAGQTGGDSITLDLA